MRRVSAVSPCPVYSAICPHMIRDRFSGGGVMRSKAAATCAAALAVLISARAPHAQAPEPQAGRRLALVGGLLLTSYEVPPVHPRVVLVEGNRIVAAGPASEIKVPADAAIVDTSGRTMLPG